MSTKTKTKAEEAITKAVRYLVWPEDVEVPPGCGYTTAGGAPNGGGKMGMDIWFTRLILPELPKAPASALALESDALRILGVKRKPGAHVEVLESVYAEVMARFPADICRTNFELYMAQRPLHLAFANAPSDRPKDWPA